MKAVRAEFIGSAVPPRYAWWLLAVLAVATVALPWDTQRMRGQLRHKEVAAQQERARAAAAETARLAALAEQERASPQAAQWRAFTALREVAWPEALATLEVTPRSALVVMSIQIDAPARSVAVEATAPDLQAVVDYLGRLNDGLPLGEARWRWSLKELRRQPQGSVYTVSIVAGWGRG